MRRYYLLWSMGVFGAVGTIYGAYSLIYHYNHGNKFPVYGLILLILGAISLVLFLIICAARYLAKGKKLDEPKQENIVEEKEPEPVVEAPAPAPSTKPESKKEEYVPRPQREYKSSSSCSVSTIYVKQVGYGPLLRIEGGRIVDMRTNTYYRIQDNMVMQDGYGPVFEIRGTQIKDAFGGYLYELSGNNINKVFGGFYASISGNYITLFDLSVKYETTDSLSKRQILVVAALLFGKY